MHLAWKEKSLLVLLAQSVSHHPKVFMVPVHILTAMLYLLVDHSKCRIQRPACYFLWGAVRNPSSVTAFGGISGSDTQRGAAPTAKCLFCNHNDTTDQTCHELSICYIYRASLWPNSNSCWRTTAPQNPWASVLWSFPVSRDVLNVHTRRPIFSGYLSAPGCWYFGKYMYLKCWSFSEITKGLQNASLPNREQRHLHKPCACLETY